MNMSFPNQGILAQAVESKQLMLGAKLNGINKK
jgi:hypothetical protein